ncbi:protein aspartic protease in guard cell 2 [Quercus suber]|uniref:Protein aspartic protease in guard cell 2 n=1 Tax=Quercus suber TaxID=58331 RepID=A0AAW0LCJ2_QUESU
MKCNAKRVANLIHQLDKDGVYYPEVKRFKEDIGSDLRSGESFIPIGLGTPPTPQYLVIDTRSDIARLVYVSTSGTSGSLVLGRERIPTGAAWASLLSNKRATSFYYIELVGLGLEGIWLPIREDVFQISKSCHGGVIMDTDTTMSTFPKVAYEALHDAFVVKTTNGEFLVLHLLHPLLIYLLSIIGNVQQEQVQITFDMASISVGFDPNNG